MAKTEESVGRLFKQPVVEHQLDGRRVPAGTPGAVKVRKLTKKWYCKIKDAETGRWKAVPLAADKQVARKLMARLISGEEAVRAGLVDDLAKYRGDKVKDYIPDFKTFMKDVRQAGDRHIKDTVHQTEAILDGCGIQTIGDLERAKEVVGDFLMKMACGPRRKNLYRQSIVFFCGYLTEHKQRFKTNPLASLPVRETPKADARRKRRAVSHETLQKFVEVVKTRPLVNAELAPTRRKYRTGTASNLSEEQRAALLLKGKERALIYATAASTGFREGELASMRVGDLNLDGPQPHIRLTGDRTKNSQDAVVPLSPEMAAALKDWVAEAKKQPADLLFAEPGYSSVMRAWKKDLAAAGISYRDDQGRYFDFHSLRKCLGTFLRLAGVDPAVSMRLMRHSDIRLTMEVYNDGQLADLHRVVQNLPQVKVG